MTELKLSLTALLPCFKEAQRRHFTAVSTSISKSVATLGAGHLTPLPLLGVVKAMFISYPTLSKTLWNRAGSVNSMP